MRGLLQIAGDLPLQSICFAGLQEDEDAELADGGAGKQEDDDFEAERMVREHPRHCIFGPFVPVQGAHVLPNCMRLSLSQLVWLDSACSDMSGGGLGSAPC